MNELCFITQGGMHKCTPNFVAKACALVTTGASLCFSKFNSDSGLDGKQLIDYRMNVPWQLKRSLFTEFCHKQGLFGRCYDDPCDGAKAFLFFRNQLMKVWDEKVARDMIHLMGKIESEKIFNQIRPLCSITAQYAVDDTYLNLENKVYYAYDKEGIKQRLVCAPEGDHKPCSHYHDECSPGRCFPMICSGPCKEVFEAFGLQKPSDQAYAALKNSVTIQLVE